jgi:ribonuclease-3
MDAARRQLLLSFLTHLGLELPADGDLAALDEALTHTSAGLARNHERLEFLGDAVLRLAASEFLAEQRSTLSVGQQSALRAQLVSDRWLAELGDLCGIEDLLRIGPVAAGDATGRATLRAEACEAVIGALYRIWGDLSPVRQWLDPHWQRSLQELQDDPHRYTCDERSHVHGDPRRFHCRVALGDQALGEGWGGSRREAEQQAARAALTELTPLKPAADG